MTTQSSQEIQKAGHSQASSPYLPWFTSLQHNKRLKGLLEITFVAIAILLVNFIVQIGFDPSYQHMSVDSALFAYCGGEINSGKLMYRDCWDNKLPAIYYLNAAVLMVGAQKLWFLWLFQSLWVSITTIFFYLVLRKIWPRMVSFLVALVFLLTLLYPDYYQGGNLTETYALLFIVLNIGSLYEYVTTGKQYHLALIGLFTAAAFMFKPTYISMGIASGIVILLLAYPSRNWRRMVGASFCLITSAFLPLILVATYWAAQGNFSDLWFATFLHNQHYVQEGLSLQSLYGTLRLFWIGQPMAAITILAGLSLITFMSENWRNLFSIFRKGSVSQVGIDPIADQRENPQIWMMVALQIAIILDIFFVSLSGKNFGHYLQIPLVAMTASIGYLLSTLAFAFRSKSGTDRWIIPALSISILLAVPWSLEIIAKETPSAADIRALVSFSGTPVIKQDSLEKYILENSRPDQTVLIWGYDPIVYLLTGRRSPTRYLFLRHLFSPTTSGSHGFDEFLGELERDPPVIIASDKTSSHALPHIELPAEELCIGCPDEVLEGILKFKRYVELFYEPSADFDEWMVYRRIELKMESTLVPVEAQ